MHSDTLTLGATATAAAADAPVLDRRRFLGAAGGLTFAFALGGGLAPREAAAAAGDTAVNAWLTVGSDDSVTLVVGATEMGQGSSSSLGQVLAEDLMVPWSRVRVVQGGPTLATPAPVGSAINTVGSGVVRSNFWRLRDAAAIARETLVMAAMARIGDADRSRYTVADGVIRHVPSGTALSYGAVAADAAKLTPPASAPLVPESEWRIIGQPLPRRDIPAKVDGSAVYGLDVRVPGMVFAAIRHCPTFGGTLAALPPTPAGALAVVPVAVAPGTGRGADLAGNVNAVAVVAATTWDAMRLARSLAPKWNLPAAAANWNSAQFVADAQALMTGAPPYVAGGANPPGTAYTVEASTADSNAALAAPGTRVVEATYELPYAAHACMEVLNCTVDFVPGVRCEVWAPTQSARGALSLVRTLTGLAEPQIVWHTTLLGGGLGRKAEHDFVAQAVQVAMAVQRPVQLVWSREEDFTHDQYRPMALVRVRAGLDAGNGVVGWQYRNVSPSILGQRGAVHGARGDSQGWEASAGLPYAFGSRLVEWVSHPSPIPVGFWRSVGASINTFAVESMIDELARAAGEDPVDFRRRRLTDPRWLAVLDAAASLGGWRNAVRSGRARGVAIGAAFNSIVASVVEVSGSSTTSFRVERVSLAIDCTLVVNPANLEAQLAGGVVHGLNAALHGRQTFVAGVAQRRNFNTHRMIRIGEMPQVAVTVVPRSGPPDRTVPIGGVGELGVPTLAPALANALARLTGQRVRSLPLRTA